MEELNEQALKREIESFVEEDKAILHLLQLPLEQKELSEKLGIEYHHFRNRLKIIYEKLGFKGQKEIIYHREIITKILNK